MTHAVTKSTVGDTVLRFKTNDTHQSLDLHSRTMETKTTMTTQQQTLLSVPKSDIIPSTEGSTTNTTNEAPLLLLQLPPNTSPHQLSHFVADNTRASLITDCSSYSVHTLGTSNALILLEKENDTNNNTSATARLLHHGKGASYLELKPPTTTTKPYAQWDALIQEAMLSSNRVVDPEQWARRLHVSVAQIQQWLQPDSCDTVMAYPTPDNNSLYTLMELHDVWTCQQTILSTLTECHAATAATTPIPAGVLCPQALERVPPSHRSRITSPMVQYCAQQLCTGSEGTTTVSDLLLQFDFKKVGNAW